ncbi:MAG: transketolase family protein [Candidatus Dormibacteraceae bacterium]
MRRAFISTLVELAERDPRIVLLTADLGFMALEPFSAAFPDRFFNVGVSEQNMLGLATGLAEAGMVPFVYSIAPFATLRPYEFIRQGPLLHRLPVRIVGVGGGMEYGPNGMSHYALEDVAVMRAQPSMTVIAPADHQQAREALLATAAVPGPIYFRLGKDDTTVVPGLNGAFELGKIQRIREGPDAAVIALGPIAAEAVAACELLAARGLHCAVAVVACVSPPPTEDLESLLAGRLIAVTVEVHYPAGGLGSLVSEVIAERGLGVRLLRQCVRSMPDGRVGSQRYMERTFGLSAEQLAGAVSQELATR